MPDKRTDAEVICRFMEPKPELSDEKRIVIPSRGGWWLSAPMGYGRRKWVPVLEACKEYERFGHLREIEERLTEEQRVLYQNELLEITPVPRTSYSNFWAVVHASAEQKIAALAAALRAREESR